MSWTQPICDDRWRQMHGNRVAGRLKDPDNEDRCCYCNRPTDGIFIRVDPATVPYPRSET